MNKKKNNLQKMGPWDPILEQLREWDPTGADLLTNVSTNPWTNGVLPIKTIELICVSLNATCTNLQTNGTRRHIRAALEAGATREEILMALKIGFGPAIHSCSLGAPILLEEAKAAGVKLAQRDTPATPACDTMRSIGQWNAAWDPFFELDPLWTDQFFAFGASIYQGKIFTQKEIEFFSIALDASYTHMYAPGTRRHIKIALNLGATMEEIMEVLKICVVLGIESCNLGVPILAEELEHFKHKQKNGKKK